MNLGHGKLRGKTVEIHDIRAHSSGVELVVWGEIEGHEIEGHEGFFSVEADEVETYWNGGDKCFEVQS